MIVKAAFTSLVGKSFRALTAAVAKNANPSIFTYYCCVGRTAKRTWKMFCIHRLPAWNAIKSHLRIFQWVLISMRLRLLHHHLKSYLMIFSRVTKNNISLLMISLLATCLLKGAALKFCSLIAPLSKVFTTKLVTKLLVKLKLTLFPDQFFPVLACLFIHLSSHLLP